MKTRWLCVPIVFLLFIASAANAGLISTFDDDAEGWWTAGGSDGTVHAGSYIYAQDTSINDAYYFDAPDSWDGDWSAYIGGTLEFDIKIISIGNDDSAYFYNGWEDVVIRSVHGVYMEHHTGIQPVVGAWTHFSVSLVASSFSVDESVFNTIMANFGGLKIRGDYMTYLDDITALDNVSVSSQPIPAPAALLLFSTGLVGLIGYRRKK